MKNIHCLLMAFMCTLSCVAQDSVKIDIIVPEKLFEKISSKQEKLAANIQRENLKILNRLEKQEQKLYKRLSRIDSSKAAELYGKSLGSYKVLKEKIKQPVSKITRTGSGYIPRMDSLKGILQFLEPLAEKKEAAAAALAKVEELKTRLAQTGDIKKLIAERQAALKGLGAKFQNAASVKGLIEKYTGKYGRLCYYYKAQAAEWKETIKDPAKIETEALKLLSKLPAFKEFMKQNGELSQLFGSPSNTPGSIGGLQTRTAITQQLQQRFGSAGINPQQYVQQQLQTAQGTLNELKAKANGLRSGSIGDASMPDFIPNQQKIKPFLKRLQYGFDLQTGARQYQFPASNDLAVSVGYKLNDRFVTGFGLAYKFGLGESIKHMHFTNDGIGFRSFIDWKVSSPGKGVKALFSNIWLSSGYEKNYWAKFKDIPELQNVVWQESGLVGLAKKITYGKREMKTQVLWDFLSYKSHATPVLFRIGYNF